MAALRGAAAHLWWSYYRAMKKREGVIGAAPKANTVSNKVAVAKRSSTKAKTRDSKTAGTETMNATDFIVARDDLQACKTIQTQIPDADTLPADGLLVRVDRFALTANNITYAVMGDQLKYWSLFPAPDGFGNIPVWGFGDVIASKHPECRRRRTPVRLFPDGDASRDRSGRRQQARPA